MAASTAVPASDVEVESDEALFTRIPRKLGEQGEKLDVQSWHAASSGSVIHRVGILAPPLVMQLVNTSRLVVWLDVFEILR